MLPQDLAHFLNLVRDPITIFVLDTIVVAVVVLHDDLDEPHVHRPLPIHCKALRADGLRVKVIAALCPLQPWLPNVLKRARRMRTTRMGGFTSSRLSSSTVVCWGRWRYVSIAAHIVERVLEAHVGDTRAELPVTVVPPIGRMRKPL